jgi:hypothetical protein
MKQFTPKTLAEALAWIHSQPHYDSGVDKANHDGTVVVTHLWYRNNQQRMRVAKRHDWVPTLMHMIEPNDRPHDDRMYKLTRYGRMYLMEHGHQTTLNLHP